MPDQTSQEDRFWVSPGGRYYKLSPNDSQAEWIVAHQDTLPLPPKYDRLRGESGTGLVDERSTQLTDDGSPQPDEQQDRDEEQPIITEEELIEIGYSKVSLHDRAMFITTARGTSKTKLLDIIWNISNFAKVVDLAQVSVLYVGEDNFTRLNVYTNREWF